jgi:serine/threonine protein kinase
LLSFQDAEEELHRMYEILEVVGVGSTSSCHRCIVRETGEARACKLIDKYTLEERFQGMLDQLTVEIDALRQLRGHPNIIKLYDVFFAPNQIVIVMEYMQGGELFDYVVQKGTLTEEEASNIVRQVTSALVYMHAHNICHRDLKPENLLLKEKPQPHRPICIKIIDFGLAKIMKEDPVASSFLGTRGYLAPEMLQRQDYTRAIDTWALGVIVFVLLCGCLPFDDDAQELETLELLHEKFTLRFPKWSRNLSPSAKDLLKHLLEINPRLRYTAEQVLSHSWVQGSTASAQALLASPGRIRKSPKIMASLRPPEERSTPSPASVSPSSLRYRVAGATAGTSVVSLSSSHYIHPPARLPPPPPVIANAAGTEETNVHYQQQQQQQQQSPNDFRQAGSKAQEGAVHQRNTSV